MEEWLRVTEALYVVGCTHVTPDTRGNSSSYLRFICIKWRIFKTSWKQFYACVDQNLLSDFATNFVQLLKSWFTVFITTVSCHYIQLALCLNCFLFSLFVDWDLLQGTFSADVRAAVSKAEGIQPNHLRPGPTADASE